MFFTPDVSAPPGAPRTTPDAPAEPDERSSPAMGAVSSNTAAINRRAAGAAAANVRSNTPPDGVAPVAVRETELNPDFEVREADLEPYIGLRYLSRLFRVIAAVLVILLAAGVINALMTTGFDDWPTLVSEVSWMIVLAGLLWGSGDLATLLIDMGHDLRATRILLGRQLAHHTAEQHATIDPALHNL